MSSLAKHDSEKMSLYRFLDNYFPRNISARVSFYMGLFYRSLFVSIRAYSYVLNDMFSCSYCFFDMLFYAKYYIESKILNGSLFKIFLRIHTALLTCYCSQNRAQREIICTYV